MLLWTVLTTLLVVSLIREKRDPADAFNIATLEDCCESGLIKVGPSGILGGRSRVGVTRGVGVVEDDTGLTLVRLPRVWNLING